MKFKFWNLETHFHNRRESFLVVKTVKFKHGISQTTLHQTDCRAVYKKRWKIF